MRPRVRTSAVVLLNIHEGGHQPTTVPPLTTNHICAGCSQGEVDWFQPITVNSCTMHLLAWCHQHGLTGVSVPDKSIFCLLWTSFSAKSELAMVNVRSVLYVGLCSWIHNAVIPTHSQDLDVTCRKVFNPQKSVISWCWNSDCVQLLHYDRIAF